MIHVVASHRPGVERDRAHLRAPAHHRDLGRADLVGVAAGRELDAGRLHVIRGALRDALLEEGVAHPALARGQDHPRVHALRPALERGGPGPERAHDAVLDGDVVLDDVELGERGRALGGREDHAIRVRHPQVAPAGIDDRGFGQECAAYATAHPGQLIGDALLLAAAGFAAGAVNAVAGGGSLISFPALLGVGYGAVTANVTNAVAVLPGYLGGSFGYRRELRGQESRIAALGVTSALGSLGGAVLLLVTSKHLFRELAPFLILFSCALLAAQPLLARAMRPPAADRAERSIRLHLLDFASAVYGGYFGAGLGIMLLAVLGLCIDDDLQRLNALKGLLSFVIGLVAAIAFAFFGDVRWPAAAVMAVASLVGGHAGVGLARRLGERTLRFVVVTFGVAVAVVLLA